MEKKSIFKVLELLEAGGNLGSLGHATTVRRVLTVKTMTDDGDLVGQVRIKPYWEIPQVRRIQGYIEEFYSLHPELLVKRESPLVHMTLEATPSSVQQIGEQMWVPDPNKIDLPSFDTGSGPRTNVADGRSIYWVKVGRTVVRCWLSDVEENRLGEIFDFLEECNPQTIIRARYHEIQSEMTDFFGKIRRYRCGVYRAGELESIRGLHELILGNVNIDLEEHRYAITN